MQQEILEINDIYADQDKRPWIQVETIPALKEKWLFDTGASITAVLLMNLYQYIKVFQ